MPPCLSAPRLVCFALGFAALGRAAPPTPGSPDASAPTSTEAAPPVQVAKDPAPPAGREHIVSDETASHVTSGLPKYAPHPPEPAKPGTESPDLRETDKPKNSIPRLPMYMVTRPREPRLPVFRERQFLTPKGLLELALKRQPGLKFGNLFGLNNGIALAMYAEQERLDDLAEFKASVASARDAGETTEADALERQQVRFAYRASIPGGAEHAGGQ